jgi:hypothetical protein
MRFLLPPSACARARYAYLRINEGPEDLYGPSLLSGGRRIHEVMRKVNKKNEIFSCCLENHAFMRLRELWIDTDVHFREQNATAIDLGRSDVGR